MQEPAFTTGESQEVYDQVSIHPVRHLRARMAYSPLPAEPAVCPMRGLALTCQCELVTEGQKCAFCAGEAVAEWVAQKNLKARTPSPKRKSAGVSLRRR